MPQSRWFNFITAGFVATLIISNLIAVKLISLGSLILPAAVIIFPISYIFGDVLTEVYGYSRARQVIWTGFFWNLFAVAAIWLAGVLPAAGFWQGQEAWNTIFGFAPRILAASFIAYLFGEFLNSFVLAKMKVAMDGKNLWMRTIGSTLVGQLADSAIFLAIAFGGTMPIDALGQLIVTQWLFKTVYEAVITPLTYLVVNGLKRAEGIDVYDRETNFNPLPLAE
jgi:queuosine precursor transporter